MFNTYPTGSPEEMGVVTGDSDAEKSLLAADAFPPTTNNSAISIATTANSLTAMPTGCPDNFASTTE
jgi:hypothetical protein